MTATFSPSEMFAMRTAFSAMLPSVVKQACSKGTPSGIFDNEIAADEDGLSVSRAFAAIGDAVANFKIGDSGMFLDHYTRARISRGPRIR